MRRSSMRKRTLAGRFPALLLASICAVIGVADASAVTVSPNPIDLSDPGGIVARFTFVGESTGLPAGGVVLAGAVAPTDVVLMFTVEYVAQSISPLALAQVGRSAGTLSGMGWIPGDGDDWALFALGTFPQAVASFASATLDTGAVGDVIFISAASFPEGTALGFYFQGFHGVPQASGSATVVPEPMTAALLAGGLALLARARRR